MWQFKCHFTRFYLVFGFKEIILIFRFLINKSSWRLSSNVLSHKRHAVIMREKIVTRKEVEQFRIFHTYRMAFSIEICLTTTESAML
jgi:hypothetical protein